MEGRKKNPVVKKRIKQSLKIILVENTQHFTRSYSKRGKFSSRANPNMFYSTPLFIFLIKQNKSSVGSVGTVHLLRARWTSPVAW